MAEKKVKTRDKKQTGKAKGATKPKRKRTAGGRPKANIDWRKTDMLLKAGATGTGIAGMLGIHPNTLYEECKRTHKISFSEYSQLKRSIGLEMLKVKQYEKAMQGDNTMLIWIGKNYMGQTDKLAVKETIIDTTSDLSLLSDEDLDKLELLLSKAEPVESDA